VSAGIAQLGRITGGAGVAPDYAAVIATPVAGLRLGLCFAGAALCSLDFLDDRSAIKVPRSPAADAAVAQLRSYFADPQQPLDIPLAAAGTPFQQRVWAALCAIPPGATRRYGELAGLLQSSARAVGGACRANPIPLFVPCHRVVAAAGDGGFMGHTVGPALALKRWLLQHERARS